MIQLTIDDKPVSAKDGATVLEAATAAAIEIPTLCAHPDLEPSGACRLCVVEIDGIRGFPTSCTTPAAAGMVVRTRTPKIMELRKSILKLLLSGHTSPCIVCLHKELCEKYKSRPSKAGKVTRCAACSNRDACIVRKLSEEYGVTDLDLPIGYKNLGLERMDPFMDRDYNLCVLCGRCVRVCRNLHGKAAIDFIGRGEDARIGTAFHRDHTESGCLFCGACIDICPTGALTDRYAKWHGAADETVQTACNLCPLGCALNLKLKAGKTVGAEATAFTQGARICAIGRFVLPQMSECPPRLTGHTVRLADGIRKADYETAVAEAARKLTGISGTVFTLVAQAAATREDLHVFRKFAKQVMKSDAVVLAGRAGERVALRPDTKAVLATGDFVNAESWNALEVKILADVLPSPASETANVVFGAAVPPETDGTFLAAGGTLRSLAGAAKAPAGIVPDWKIVCDVARAMGAPGFDFASAADIRKELDASGTKETPPPAPDPSPLDTLSALPRFYRGHSLVEISGALKAIFAKEAPAPKKPVKDDGRRFRIVAKKEIVPNMHSITVRAPEVAAKCMPGQFVIAMVNEKSERIPYTVADWDRKEGTVTLNVIEAGRSSQEISFLNEGDRLAHFVGPLGTQIEVRKYGTVVCGGGCYGVGGIFPIARALKEAGNKVICIEEASSAYLLHWQDKLASVCDELVIVTKDGSAGLKGGVQEAIAMLAKRGEKIDQAFIMGCTFMMMLVSAATKELGIPTLTSLSPLMVDGTGMCGACRVTVGGTVKFSCVDGPFLDGHQVDWIELMQRGSSYVSEEIKALPQDLREHACMRD